MSSPFKSCLYDCEVVHERLSPRRHGFRYRLFFMDIDLDELPALAERHRFFSRNGFNLYAFRDKDHLDLGQPSAKANILLHLQRQGLDLPADTRVRLVTLPSVLGYIFNPVCFYFFFSKDGTPLHALAEVTNTFHEMKPYLIREPDAQGVFDLTTPKHFYVSPFSTLDTCFHFRLEVPDGRIKIHIDDLVDGQRTLLSWIHGERRELTDSRLLWYAVRYPALTLMVVARIHWQALKLWWLKKLPFHRKADLPGLQRDVHRPHASLTAPSKP